MEELLKTSYHLKGVFRAMEKSNDSSTTNPKPEDTRCGGPDDTREGKDCKETPLEEEVNVQRGAPVESRLNPR
jgi:hypothetical protein